MEEQNVILFKMECERCLARQGINTLRAYGRSLGMQAPTRLKKGALISEIVGALCGENMPTRNKLGAPIKNDYIKPEIVEEVSRLKELYFGEEEPKAQEEASASEEVGVSLRFTVNPSKLNEVQKQRLNEFLNSL